MCISASASIKSFLVSVIACLMLVVFGRNEFKVYNWITAAFFIYVSLMQLVDLGMWIDLDCKSGTNKLASILGPIIHYIQPLMAFIIPFLILNYTAAGKTLYNTKIKPLENKYPLYRLFSVGHSKKLNIIHLLNIGYLIFIIGMLIRYFYKASKEPTLLCNRVSPEGHLKWNWLKDCIQFLVMHVWHLTILNVLLINIKSSFLIGTFVLLYFLLFFSIAFKKKYAAEIWCYISNSVPVIILGIQHILPNILT